MWVHPGLSGGQIGSGAEIGTSVGKNGLRMVMFWLRMWLPLLQTLPMEVLGKGMDSGVIVD